MPRRANVTRLFLWISVLAWGILVGAKLFDLRVLAGAWSASPPESLRLLPYGPRFPVDTGEFFIPSSAALLVASFGALISGWQTPRRFRVLLLVSAVMISLPFPAQDPDALPATRIMKALYATGIAAALLFVIYFLVVVPMNQLNRITTKPAVPKAPATRKCPECLSEIPIGATRCAFCTTMLKAGRT